MLLSLPCPPPSPNPTIHHEEAEVPSGEGGGQGWTTGVATGREEGKEEEMRNYCGKGNRGPLGHLSLGMGLKGSIRSSEKCMEIFLDI